MNNKLNLQSGDIIVYKIKDNFYKRLFRRLKLSKTEINKDVVIVFTIYDKLFIGSESTIDGIVGATAIDGAFYDLLNETDFSIYSPKKVYSKTEKTNLSKVIFDSICDEYKYCIFPTYWVNKIRNNTFKDITSIESLEEGLKKYYKLKYNSLSNES